MNPYVLFTFMYALSFLQEGKFVKTDELTEHCSSMASTHAFYFGGLSFICLLDSDCPHQDIFVVLLGHNYILKFL